MALILPNTIGNDTPADGAKLQQNFAVIQDWANQDAITADGSTGMTSPLLLPGAPTQPNQAATKAYVDSSVPVGVMQMYLGTTAPASWMLCQGQAINRATYAALFTVLGTTYGAGDGSTTFNLPNMQGRSPMALYPGGPWAATLGAALGNATSTLPSHTHTGADHLHSDDHMHTGTTAGANARHRHGSGPFSFYTGGFAHQMKIDNGSPSQGVDVSNVTDVDSPDHAHAFSTNYKSQQGFGDKTGAADRVLTTSAAGADPTNTNIHPIIVVNFIVKVQ